MASIIQPLNRLLECSHTLLRGRGDESVAAKRFSKMYRKTVLVGRSTCGSETDGDSIGTVPSPVMSNRISVRPATSATPIWTTLASRCKLSSGATLIDGGDLPHKLKLANGHRTIDNAR